MKRYLFGLIGLAFIGAGSLIGQTLAFGGEAACCPEAACNFCGNGCHNGCGDCCPRYGCKLVPVCQITCTTKKTAEHKYCCACKDICIPGVTPICGRCDNCDTGNNGGQDCCDCRCRVREVHKLVVHPVTKETPARVCTVQWVCPNCSGNGSAPTLAPSVAPAAPLPAAPPPPPSTNRLPPPPKTTDIAPLPGEIGMARAGF
ncbi:MAG: hypothetical protein ABSG53_10495 [Thermoguttaceae bacterium]